MGAIEVGLFRFWFIPLALWVGFFILFWHLGDWNKRVVKVMFISLGCALIAGITVIAVLFSVVHIFD